MNEKIVAIVLKLTLAAETHVNVAKLRSFLI